MTRLISEQEAQLVVNAAKSLIGTPFQHAGRNQYGLDCLGLLVLATRMCGMDVYDNKDYSMAVDSVFMRTELSRVCRALKPDEPVQIGDVHLFRITRQPTHVGLVSEVVGGVALKLLHSYQSIGRVVEHHYDQSWKDRLACAFRLELD